MQFDVDEKPEGPVWSWPRTVLKGLTGLSDESLDDELSQAAKQRRSFTGPHLVEGDEVMQWARWSEGEANRYEDGYFKVENGDWRYDGGYDVERLMPLFSDWQSCAQWFRAECENSILEERDGYAFLLLQEIEEPVILAELSGGRVDVWGGWHRVAAAILKGATDIPAIVGVPHPSPVLVPQP